MWRGCILFFCVLVITVHQGLSRNADDDDDTGMHDFSQFRDYRVGADGGGGGNGGASNINEQEKQNKFWIDSAINTLISRTHLQPNTKKAKNIILFLGDGMGVSTHTAARIYQGQLNGQNGEENSLNFEKFPYTGLSKTYCVDSQVADSACTSTAYTNGVKGSIGTLGLNGRVLYRDCKGSKDNTTHTESIIHWAIKAGKSTGVVTTTRITHASPAGTYSHSANRDWEADTDREASVDCQDIASQLIKNHPGHMINVLLGGGLKKFTLKKDGGQRLDEDLLLAYERMRQHHNQTYKIVKTKQELAAVNASTKFLLGLFADSHLEYEVDKQVDKNTKVKDQPSLTEMTQKAIEVLSKNQNGFYLFVEGGKIDIGHHGNKAKKALTETIEFDNAIKKALQITNPDETLIVVTADHSHTFTIAGYPDRGNKILERVRYDGHDLLGLDKLPYLTLGYNNGPGFRPAERNGYRHDINLDKTDDKDYRIPSGIPLEYETHGGEDVAVFSNGPWAHLLVGNFEQNYIPIVMAYAARIGPAKDVPLVSAAVSAGPTETLLIAVVSLVVCKFLAKYSK
ncbi:hypothetical protein M8J77_003673 [Diaphorina citri]|nr:hypothetical protein M8J77_003673 [Diaphorina citri]